jgi:hypothetical protein
MDGEIRGKEEAEAKWKELWTQHNDLQRQWKDEVAALKSSMKEREQTLQAQIATLNESHVVLEAELSSAKQQLSETKLSLYKAREGSQTDHVRMYVCETYEDCVTDGWPVMEI